MFAINPQLGNWGQGILGKQILSSRNMWFLLEKIKFWLITLKIVIFFIKNGKP